MMMMMMMMMMTMMINSSQDADLQYQESIKTTASLVEKIVSQAHETLTTAECAERGNRSASNKAE